MKKVIIVLDFDPCAQTVAEVGYSIAKALGAEITLMHVKSEVKYYSSACNAVEIGLTGNSKQDMFISQEIINTDFAAQEFLKKMKLQLGDKSIKTLAVRGNAETIIREKRIQSDLIIMGSHSQRWYENKTIGSFAKILLQRGSIPVLIIPTNNTNFKMNVDLLVNDDY